MVFAGIDLHKKTITVCVVDQHLNIQTRKTLPCDQPQLIRQFFARLGAFQTVVEATASYQWLWELLEPRAHRLLLAHPKKLRVIAESTRKSDRLDAQVLAEFLGRDMIPQAYRPTPRQRQHRALVRQRCFVRRRSGAARTKIRRILADYHADRRDLFTPDGLASLAQLPLSQADRFVVKQLLAQWQLYQKQLRQADQRLRLFARKAPVREAEARAVLASIPGIGPLTVDIVLSELADIERFASAKEVVAYAGLAPGRRESAGKSKDLGITKEGSRWLRWALIEAAWRLVRLSRRWARVFESLHKRCGKKKAIVAIARRLLTVMVAVWRKGENYRLAT
jgi:transposase